MTSRTEKLRTLGEVQELLGVSDADIPKIPEIVQQLVVRVAVPPCVVTFAFDPPTGELRQIALSEVPTQPEAYQAVAQVATKVAQQFQNIAVEVAKHAVAEEERVGGGASSSQDDEPRVGPGPEGHGVGEMAPPGPGAGNSNE